MQAQTANFSPLTEKEITKISQKIVENPRANQAAIERYSIPSSTLQAIKELHTPSDDVRKVEDISLDYITDKFNSSTDNTLNTALQNLRTKTKDLPNYVAQVNSFINRVATNIKTKAANNIVESNLKSENAKAKREVISELLEKQNLTDIGSDKSGTLLVFNKDGERTHVQVLENLPNINYDKFLNLTPDELRGEDYQKISDLALKEIKNLIKNTNWVNASKSYSPGDQEYYLELTDASKDNEILLIKDEENIQLSNYKSNNSEKNIRLSKISGNFTELAKEIEKTFGETFRGVEEKQKYLDFVPENLREKKISTNSNVPPDIQRYLKK
ncbi:MAG: hypothetical protein HRT47_02640 [Candidatus Caenarcaniphilales bacterium]|nr:hypothetical protein [Candidatus Caenarcaniphilales bacterium]